MKAYVRIASLLLATLLLGGCTAGGTTNDTTAEAATDSAAVTEETTETPTEQESETPTEEETTMEETTADTQPTLPERTVVDVYGNSYNTNMIVGFDEYGRSVTAASATRADKEVGIFYFLWLGFPFANDIYDVSKILEEHGKDVLFHQADDVISPEGQAHWWAEPLYGYYSSGDEYIIRRHMEMLTDAGVDFLVFDTTNAVIYANTAKRIMKISAELRAEGWDEPQVVFYTHSYSIQTIRGIYETFYATETYPESWYRVDGKPMIIGYADAAKDKAEASSREDYAYDPGDLEPAIRDFFYLREACWPNDEHNENSWPYTEWTYPQPLNGDMVSVSIATHPRPPFSFNLTHDNWGNWGRGYDVKRKRNIPADAMKGTFFASQWETALELDPRFVFITGWNEWVAYKSPYLGEYMLCDNVDLEFSRDAEPMKGGYEDAYYIQMMDYIRQYKYESMEGKKANAVLKTIDVSGAVTQWNDVNAIYRRVGTDDGKRAAYGGSKVVYYEQAAVENNILEVRVTSDSENIYFYIQTENAIKTSDKANFMNILIGTGSTPIMKGWESYEFVIGRSRDGSTASIEKLNADFSGETLEATATYSVQGNVMQVSVPRAALGLTATDAYNDFYFKVADGVSDPAEIMDYYVTGRSLPMGRLSYLYQMD